MPKPGPRERGKKRKKLPGEETSGNAKIGGYPTRIIHQPRGNMERLRIISDTVQRGGVKLESLSAQTQQELTDYGFVKKQQSTGPGRPDTPARKKKKQ